MSRIHPTAMVAPAARIAEDVEIGPYCCIGAEVEIEPGAVLLANVVIEGRTRIGAGTRIHSFASLGQPPQSIGFEGPGSGLDIGCNNVIREYVTMNTGTNGEGTPTSVGDNGLFMPGVHVAHDCHLGPNVVMSDKATLAGHVSIGGYATIGSQTAIHQYSRIGKHALVGGSTAVGKDIVPFAIAAGYGPQLRGLNVAGLRRWNFPPADIRALRDAYREIFLGGGSYTARLFAVAEKFRAVPVVMELIDFITADKSRPICTVTAGADE
jgi:UDP-N-acetylglucosamine acyltransferase